MAEKKAGRVSQVIGAVVDVTFDGHLPATKVIKVVRIFAEVDETAVPTGVRGIGPGNDKDGIFCGGFYRPFDEHQCLS